MQRPDFSDYVAHFTRTGNPHGQAKSPDFEGYVGMPESGYERIINILQQRRVRATPMPWTGQQAACFTECPWWSLIDHAEHYSPYGVGFAKARLFAAGGAPALYVRPDHYDKQREYVSQSDPSKIGFHPRVHAFVTPFVPDYAPAKFKGNHLAGKYVDFSHEREWRVPHDFTFEYSQVEFVILDTYGDMARFPAETKDAVGREKFLLMDVYRRIEHLWPTHLTGGQSG